MTRFLSVFLAGAFAGCSASTPPTASSTNATIHLTATKLSPTDIQVSWKDPAPNAAGHIVEWTTDPAGQFVILAFLPPDVTSFTHPDLMSDMPCHYRVRPYFGLASSPVELTTGKDLPNEEIKVDDETWANPKTISTGEATARKSIHNPSTAAEAAPTDLKARLIRPTGIQFTWVDHAADEEGYLLEVKPDAMPQFQVCALVESNINSYGYGLVPPETKVSFRVRAFYFGQPSNLVSEKTGPAPPAVADQKPQ